jgi:hypothetical protein
VSHPLLLAHGVGSREDLPLPFGLALTGAAVALLVSFLGLGLLWRTSRLDPARAGRPVPVAVQRLLDARATRLVLRLVGLAVTAYVVMAATVGKDDALNPTPGVVYVLFWIGVPLASVVVGPVWRLVNPVRTVHEALSRLLGTRPEDGLARLPERLGCWPAAAWLLAFAWLELVAPGNDTLPVLRTFFAAYFAVNLLAATYYGSRWFGRGDGFEVYFTLVGRLSPLGRRPDGRIVLRNPLVSAAATPPLPGLFAVVGVLLGSTAYDSMSNAPWWVTFVQNRGVSPRLTETAGLLVVTLLVTGAFAAASALSARAAHRRQGFAGEFAHTLIPIVVGYVVAHYWSLLVLIGQATVIRLSDPLGTGADWLGTADWGIDSRPADPTFVSVLQVCAVVLGHVVAVVLAHDRAVRLLPRRHAVAGQVPMLVLMVVYTVGGLSLLFGA